MQILMRCLFEGISSVSLLFANLLFVVHSGLMVIIDEAVQQLDIKQCYTISSYFLQ